MNMNFSETWRRAAKIKTCIFDFSYNSFKNIVQVLIREIFFGIWQARINREALVVKNAFSYVDMCRLEGLNPKAIMKLLIQACDYKYCIIV